MATAQLHKQPEIAIGDIIARELEYSQSKAVDERRQIEAVTGNVKEEAISFHSNLLGSCKFEGSATTAIGNSGITGLLYEEEKLSGEVFFIYQMKEEELHVWFYKSPDYGHSVGELKAKASKKFPKTKKDEGLGTGVFTRS